MSQPHDTPRARNGGGRASEITPRAVEWLWWPYIPLGKITAVAGQMGQAKSLFTVWLAAAATTGSGLNSTPGSVILLSAEDDAEDTVRPRLEAAGADLERVWIEPGATLDSARLSEISDEMGDVVLITVDPITAYMPGKVNTWKSQDVRLELEPLRTLAAERAIAVVVVQHLNRRADAADPLSRIADSQGIPQLARSVLIWGPDPSDPESDRGSRKVLTKAKGNLARASASATFTIVERSVTSHIKAPALERGHDRDITADEVLADAETRTAVDEAAEWLRELLRDGPVPAKEGIRRAREVGISDSTLKRARRKADVKAEPRRDDTTIDGWVWELKDSYKTDDPLELLDPLDPLDE